MTTHNSPRSSRPVRGVGPGLLGLALLAGACDDDPVRGTSRMAVVFVDDDGSTHTVGSYDADSGELDFVPRAKDDLRAHLGVADYRAIVADAEQAADIDLDTGVAVLATDLDEGDALELRVLRSDAPTLTLGQLVLQVAPPESFRRSNKVWPDDWLAPV